MMSFTLKDVLKAKHAMSRFIVRTPRYSRRLSRILDFNVFLKLENIQVTRSFKVRGGLYYMSVKIGEAIKRGVIVASTGNHAQSIAYATSIYGIRAIIVMRHGIPRV